jgi:hypothetical protein
VRNVVELAGPQPRPLQTVGRLSALATRMGRLEECSCLHWPTKLKRGWTVYCVKTIHRRDTKFRQSVKSVTLGCANLNVSKTPHKGTVLGSKSQQRVIQGDYHVQRTLLMSYVITISEPSNNFLTTHHVLLFSVVLCFILALNT